MADLNPEQKKAADHLVDTIEHQGADAAMKEIHETDPSVLNAIIKPVAETTQAHAKMAEGEHKPVLPYLEFHQETNTSEQFVVTDAKVVSPGKGFLGTPDTKEVYKQADPGALESVGRTLTHIAELTGMMKPGEDPNKPQEKPTGTGYDGIIAFGNKLRKTDN
ncbi:MAG: hypothetical protein K2X81_11485 [Candidatus Obscuribacterales bacterium]|nr:hypothetical protein [Candidatus Obscuribacterales bacterium]